MRRPSSRLRRWALPAGLLLLAPAASGGARRQLEEAAIAAGAPASAPAPAALQTVEAPAPHRLDASRRQRLLEQLSSKDADHGGAIVPDPGSIEEAEAAVALYERGDIGLPRRPDSPRQGDFVDPQGRHYDVKAPFSADELIAKIRREAAERGEAWRAPPHVRGEFDLDTLLEVIREQKDKGRRVILDTKHLDPADRAALEAALRRRPELWSNVLWYP